SCWVRRPRSARSAGRGSTPSLRSPPTSTPCPPERRRDAGRQPRVEVSTGPRRRGEPDSEREGEGASAHLAALAAAQVIHGTAWQRVVLGEQPGQELLIAPAAVAQDRQGPGEVRDDAVLVEEQGGDHAHLGLAAADRDELAVLDQAPYARDLHVQSQCDIGEGEPVC